MKREPGNSSRIKRWVLFLVLATAFVSGWYLLPNSQNLWIDARDRIVGWQQYANKHQLEASLLFVFAYVLVTGFSLPFATVMSLLAGAIFGRWYGTALAVTAATIGATFSFWSSRYLLRDWVRSRLSERLTSLENGIARDGAFYLLTIRLIPLFPFFVVNLAMGLTPLRTRTFVWASWLGMIPGAFAIVNVGTAAATIESPQGVISHEVLVALSLLSVLPLLLKWVLGRVRHTRTRGVEESLPGLERSEDDSRPL
jgi:uncharacterized membrane protein YdjX (TVP38/TMEM64 family)